MKTKQIDLLHPPAEWFARPAELKPGHGTTITDDGHVFGYLALFDARYINGGKGSTKPPHSRSGYAYANSFTTVAADGKEISTGVIAGDGGHRYANSWKRTQAAYADTSNLLARVKYGEDQHGVWFSGAVWPKADEHAIETLRSTGVSGHWERPRPGAQLELLAACTVNIPGFAQHRLCASATPGGGLILEPASTLVGGEIPTSSTDPDHASAPHGSGLNPFKPGQAIPGGLVVGGGALVAAGGMLAPISGVLCVLNSPTIDGRTINDVDWWTTPLPLMYCDEQGWGHMGAKNVGSIEEITIDGSVVKFSGFIDTALEKAAEAEIIANLKTLGVSIDGYPEGDVEVVYDENGWPDNFIFEKIRIFGATLTTIPAFQETRPITIGPAVAMDEDEVPASGDVTNEQDEREQDEETATAGDLAASAGVAFGVDEATGLLDEAAELLEAEEPADEAVVLDLIIRAKAELAEEDVEDSEDEDEEEMAGNTSASASDSQKLATTTIRPPIVWH